MIGTRRRRSLKMPTSHPGSEAVPADFWVDGSRRDGTVEEFYTLGSELGRSVRARATKLKRGWGGVRVCTANLRRPRTLWRQAVVTRDRQQHNSGKHQNNSRREAHVALLFVERVLKSRAKKPARRANKTHQTNTTRSTRAWRLMSSRL